MFKTASSKLIPIVAICVLSLVACGESKDEEGSTATIAAASPLLMYVPADSPYVFAGLKPLPDDVMDKLEPNIDRILQSYEVLLQEIVVMVTAELEVEGGEENADSAEKIVSVVSELSSLMSVDGLRAAGFERTSRSVLYGNGLLPVARFEVSDGALFEAALKRMEASSGEKMDLIDVSGSSVRSIDLDEIKVLILILDKQVVISLAPTGFDEQQLSSLLGLTKPASNIMNTDVLTKIAGKYGFEDYFVAYVDVLKIAETLTGDASGIDADLVAMAGDADELSDVCQADIRSMAGIAPRMVMGYTGITTEQFDTVAVVEFREDIAAGLKTWPAAVPGLGGDSGGLLSLGMSIDIKAVRSFVEAQLDRLEKEPYLCEAFADLQGGVAQARKALQQPVPPMVYDFRGFLAVIQDIEGLNMATQTPPTSVEGQFLLAMDNAPALISLGTLMSPELAELDLQPDGAPVLLDVPQAQMAGEVVYAALADDALALSVGEGAEAALPAMLAAKGSSDGTFFSFSMDAARYYEFVAEAVALQQPDDEHPMSPEFQKAMQDILLAVADIYDRMTMDVRFTDDGLVLDSSVTLGE